MAIFKIIFSKKYVDLVTAVAVEEVVVVVLIVVVVVVVVMTFVGLSFN